MCLVGGLGAFEQGRSDHFEGPRLVAMALGAIFVATAPAMALFGLERLSRVLTISESAISLRSLFRDRRIPFDAVESVTLRTSKDDIPREVATIRGNGRSISIDSKTPGYRVVLETVASRSGVEPVRAAPIWTPGAVRLLNGAEAWIPVFMCIGIGLMLIGARQLFSDRTSAADRPASIKIGIAAAFLLASIGMAIISHHVRSLAKPDADKKLGGPGDLE